jgi:hypothetical protein
LSPILDLSVEQLQRNFETGPIAYLRMMQACHPHLKASGDGRIINFAFCVGILGMVNDGPYDRAKEAVRALTRVAAREWCSDKITVNNILPAAKTWDTDGISVPDNALARHGSPEEDIAPVALFLASKDAQFLTGYSLTPDGGLIIEVRAEQNQWGDSLFPRETSFRIPLVLLQPRSNNGFFRSLKTPFMSLESKHRRGQLGEVRRRRRSSGLFQDAVVFVSRLNTRSKRSTLAA